MIHTKNGYLTLDGMFYEKAYYDTSNTSVLAQFDGCGAISGFSVAGKGQVFVPDSFYTALSINNLSISALDEKSVEMIGRRQQVYMNVDIGSATKSNIISVASETFLDESSPCVYQLYRVINRGDADATFNLDFGYLSKDENAQIFSNVSIQLREIQDVGRHYSLSAKLPLGEVVCIKLVYADETGTSSLLDGFDHGYEQDTVYRNWLLEVSSKYGIHASQHAACLNCGINMYKEIGDFKGFFAGVHYSAPARTYYRDSYFTALGVLAHKPELVRAQLLTLASGIMPDGTCPSAVKEHGQAFWDNHLDSPQYFVILLYDYISQTKDKSILHEIAHGKSLLDWSMFISDTLLSKADENHLLYRESTNRHDWCDNIFREGYVTYIQALFAQAVKGTGKLLALENDTRAAYYVEKSALIGQAIDDLLWQEDKGYYVNYQSKDFCEDNLSIDTVLLALFDIVKPDRAKKMLEKMESLLETQNNDLQPFGDWGTMCCYPPYANKNHLVEKSSYDFVYHNGSDWPFWSCVYGLAKVRHGMDGTYPITRWFQYGLEKGWCTPCEYFNPITGKGSNLQGWSAIGAMAIMNMEEQK